MEPYASMAGVGFTFVYGDLRTVDHARVPQIEVFYPARLLHNFWRGHFRKLRYMLRYEYGYHPPTDGQSDENIKLSKICLRACLIDLELVGKCRSPVCWAEVGEVQNHGSEIVQERTERIIPSNKRVGDIAYKLVASEELKQEFIYNFHVSNLKKFMPRTLSVPLDGLHFDGKLQFVRGAYRDTDREVKRLSEAYPISQG
ncbi:hypothetical protein Tco_0561402 [Tanacetum coccineum]